MAEFVEYENQEQNDQLQTECPVESEHVEYLDIEATEIGSRRERGVRKRRNVLLTWLKRWEGRITLILSQQVSCVC